MDFLEDYGHLKYDAGVEYAYNTLLAVRESCSKISDGAIEADDDRLPYSSRHWRAVTKMRWNGKRP